MLPPPHPPLTSPPAAADHRSLHTVRTDPLQWEDPTGTRRLWESAERTTRRGAIDGVAVVALISTPSGTGPPMLPVLRQFRPPVGSYCLELPAGLVDAGETAATAAVRELFEETGAACDLLLQLQW